MKARNIIIEGGETFTVHQHIILKNFWEYYLGETDKDGVAFGYVMGFENEWGSVYLPEIEPYIVSRVSGTELNDIMPPYAYKKGLLIADAQASAMKLAVAKGVKIAMGTDIFVSGDMYGRNSLEIKFLQDAGMTALDAIEAATANGPDTLGPQAPLSGQLRQGYDADVIAVDFNPLEDSSGWGDPDRVTHVWQGGRPAKVPA